MILDKGYNSGGKYAASFRRKPTQSYSIWSAMITRCYNNKVQQDHPTYVKCYVCKEWLDFQNFAKWFEDNYVIGFQLDKDLRVINNKCYGPEFCEFVPSQINSLLLDSKNARGELPIGVTYNKKLDKYEAHCSGDKGQRRIGRYNDPGLAFQAYKAVKENFIKEQANKYKSQISIEIYNNLMNYQIQENIL